MERVTSSIYVETGFGESNVGLILTEEGGILVDTPMIPAEARRWQGEIAELLDKPLLYVINTDHHRGHALGNQFFPAPVIAHDYAWKEMKSYGESFRQRLIDYLRRRNPKAAEELTELRVVLPKLTFSNELTIHRGGKTIRIIHVGGHTPATSVIYVPEEGVLFSGDVLINGAHPFLGQANTKDWLRALDHIRRLNPRIIIPGHGAPCGMELVDTFTEYLEQLRALIRQLYREGRSKSDTVSFTKQRFLHFFPVPQKEKERFERRFRTGIGRIYEEIKAEEMQGFGG